MFKKMNAVFRPNKGQKCRDGHKLDSYHSAGTVKLVRSTSLLAVGESRQSAGGSTLKRSSSSVMIDVTTPLYDYHKHGDRIWLHSQKQDCLQYLEELVALRRQYTNCVNNLNCKEKKATVSAKKKPAPSPPSSKNAQTAKASGRVSPVPNEEDALEFFDSIIASCAPVPERNPPVDNGHEDVDFIVATSSSEHDLHSNWTLRVPRRVAVSETELKEPHWVPNNDRDRTAKKGGEGGTMRRLQRNPIHLPKVVESTFRTLRLKHTLRKKD
ncbi:uncharacterized protein C13orf42 [Megalops cyprinoides]|uniref:uncharacterized protein C13orf42 n=1 Tax=Megalops cyprinoides TaxID=118141 RepID=UPI00186551CE|nr:uncharacterized protein C13orf42 [Megalops cyprinoides]